MWAQVLLIQVLLRPCGHDTLGTKFAVCFFPCQGRKYLFPFQGTVLVQEGVSEGTFLKQPEMGFREGMLTIRRDILALGVLGIKHDT